MRRIYGLLLLLFCFTSQLVAADTLKISGNNQSYFDYQISAKYLDIFIDSSSTNISPKEIHQVNFSPFTPSFIHSPPRSCWVKFTVQNNSTTPHRWMLLQGDPHVGRVKVYTLNQNHPQLKTEGGVNLPFEKRKYKTNSIVTDIDLAPGQVNTYYVYFQSDQQYTVKLLIQSSTFFTKYAVNEYFALGAYYGILLIMALYNLFIFFSVKQKIYLFYSFYVLAIILFNTSNDLFAFQFLWPHTPSMNAVVAYLGRPILIISFVMYAYSFLPWNEYKKESNLLKITTGVFILQFLIEYHLSHTLLFHYTMLVPLIVILYVAYQHMKSGYAPARFFFTGFICVFIGLMAYIMMERGLIPANVYSVYAYNIGILIEVVVLSRAIGDRFRYLKQQKEENDAKIIHQLKVNERLKDKVNRELEEKVVERTHELAKANEDLEKANEEIQRMNELLKQENFELQYDMKELAKARLMLRDVKFEEFSKIYPDDVACYQFLANFKWRRGYTCRKCKNKKFSEGRIAHARRCTKCNYDESPTLGTIFARVKFPIVKAFYMVFLYYSSKEKLSSTDMSRILMLRQKTCWSFIQKIKTYSENKKSSLDVKKLENWTDLLLDE